jgi:hypothetical protein
MINLFGRQSPNLNFFLGDVLLKAVLRVYFVTLTYVDVFCKPGFNYIISVIIHSQLTK